jgi:hypothetical protein
MLIGTAQFGKSCNRKDYDLLGRPIGPTSHTVKSSLGGLPSSVTAVWAQEHCDADAKPIPAPVHTQDASDWLSRADAESQMRAEGLHGDSLLFQNAGTSKWMKPALHTDPDNKSIHLPTLRGLLTKRPKGSAPKPVAAVVPKRSAFDNG